MIDGIDVSRWQGLINWPVVAKNVQFAMIKIGGSDEGFYADGLAVRNVLDARAAGIPIGFYIYLGGSFSVADEVQHIKNMISNIGGLRPGEPIALDWEENHSNEVEYVYGIAKGLIDSGIAPPLIYMNLSTVRRNDWSKLVKLNCGLWVAAWGDNDAIPESNEVPGSDEWPFWAIWQFSSTGTIPGIKGRVDLNKFNGSDVAGFTSYGGRSRVTLPSPINSSKVVVPVSSVEYTVVSGDNLTSIAAKWGKTWQALWALNRDRVSQPNRIFPGQRLRVWSTQPGTAKPADPVVRSSNPNLRYHVVSNGESLSVIAAKYHLPSWHILFEANRAQITDPDYIRAGQRLIIP